MLPCQETLPAKAERSAKLAQLRDLEAEMETIGTSSLRMSSVVLPDIPKSPLKQLCVLVKFVLEKCLPQDFFHFALACMGCLPTLKPDGAHDLIDIVHHPLDHHRRVAVPRLLEKCGQRRLADLPGSFCTKRIDRNWLRAFWGP